MLTIPAAIPIRIHPMFWVLIVALGWINTFSLLGTAIWAVVIFISVLVHEYGHALTAQAFGQKAEISLVGFGGLTHRQGGRLKLWQEFIIVFNGPLAGFLLFLAAFALLQQLGDTTPQLATYALNVTLYVNLFWTFVNLLPIHPLDGGQLLALVMEGLFGLKGIKIALFLSMLLAAACALLLFALRQILAGSLFLFLTFESYRFWKMRLALSEEDQNIELWNLVHAAEGDMEEGRLDAALEKLESARHQARAGVLFVTASQYAAHILSLQGHYEKAYERLWPLKAKLTPDYLKLLHQVAFRTHHLKETLAVGKESYQNDPSYETALLNAMASSLVGQPVAAINWLQGAIRDGLPNVAQVLRKSEFNSLHHLPEFQKLLQHYDTFS